MSENQPAEPPSEARPEPGGGPQPEPAPPVNQPAGPGATPDKDDLSDQVANDEHKRSQAEIRVARAEAQASLGGFGHRSSGVKIVADQTIINGTIIAGDAWFGRDGESALVSALSVQTVDEIGRVFVEPPGFAGLVDAVASQSIVFVRAPRGWGATTLAIRLLSSLKSVHELRFTGHLGAMPVEQLPEGGGYVLEELSAERLAELRERDVVGLQDRLVARRCRLVALVPSGARLNDPAVSRRALTLPSPPLATDLVASWLADRLGIVDRANPVLSDRAVEDTLRDIGAESFSARQLVAFALDLADAVNNRCTADDAVTRFRERTSEDVEAWLDGITDTDRRAMIIALAVFNGMPFDVVSRTAAALERAWRSDDPDRGGSGPRARVSRSERMRAARARLTNGLYGTRYGVADVEIASFVDDTYPARVLHHLWHEHDYDREVIVEWLRSVAEDPEGRVRIRAASAIGYLAQYAFDLIRRDIITPWAGSGNGDERERAVAALALPARHPATAARVMRLVADWAKHSGQPLRLAAIRALGTSVGATLTGGPDEQLATLADKGTQPIGIALGDSVAELMVDASPERQLELLRLLENWSNQTRAARQVAGVWGFLEVAQGLWTTLPTPDGELQVPTLLALASPDVAGVSLAGMRGEPGTAESLREVVVRCWSLAVRAPRSDSAVHQVLRAWASAAEREPLLRPALVDLLVDVSAVGRSADILAAHARRWRGDQAIAPDLAQKLLDALLRKDNR